MASIADSHHGKECLQLWTVTQQRRHHRLQLGVVSLVGPLRSQVTHHVCQECVYFTRLSTRKSKHEHFVLNSLKSSSSLRYLQIVQTRLEYRLTATHREVFDCKLNPDLSTGCVVAHVAETSNDFPDGVEQRKVLLPGGLRGHHTQAQSAEQHVAREACKNKPLA